MSAYWHRVPLDLAFAPATLDLAARLNKRDARLYLIDLWAWTMRFAPDGVVTGDKAASIVERAAGWKGKKGAFVAAALGAGWLQETADGLIVREWQEVVSCAWTAAPEEVEASEADQPDEADREARRRAQDRARQQRRRDKRRDGDSDGQRDATPDERDASVTGRDVSRSDSVTERDGQRDERDESRVNPSHCARETQNQTETETSQRKTFVGVTPTVTGGGDVVPLVLVEPNEATPAPVAEVWEHYRSTVAPRSVLTPARRALVARALKSYSVADLKRTIDGYAKSPHHNGENDRGTKYLSLELFLRDARHVEQGWSYLEQQPAPAKKRSDPTWGNQISHLWADDAFVDEVYQT